MRAVVQRVSKASVLSNGSSEESIGCGLLVLAGISGADTIQDISWMAEKISSLRIFDDHDGKMNLSILDTGGEILAVSQFTLYGDCRKGRRPSYSDAAQPETAKPLYEAFVEELRRKGISIRTGIFQAYMKVNLENDGPVTLLLDSKKTF